MIETEITVFQPYALCPLPFVTAQKISYFTYNYLKRYDWKQIWNDGNHPGLRNLCAIVEAQFVFGPDAGGYFKIII